MYELALTPFRYEIEGRARFVLQNGVQTDSQAFFMNDERWQQIEYIVYPIPRPIGSLKTLKIEELSNTGASSISPDDIYRIKESAPFTLTPAEIQVLNGEFIIKGFLYKNGDGLQNVIALMHRSIGEMKRGEERGREVKRGEER